MSSHIVRDSGLPKLGCYNIDDANIKIPSPHSRSSSTDSGSWTIVDDLDEKLSVVTIIPNVVESHPKVRIYGDDIYCYGNIKGDVVSSALRVHLIHCKISGAVLFKNEDREPIEGGEVILDEYSSIVKYDKTEENAVIKKIFTNK